MTFNNPITGGNILIRPAIKSPDYVPGISGWTINRDGTAEFNSAEFRGPVDFTDASGYRLEINIDPTTSRPAILFYDNANNLKAYLLWDPATDAFQLSGIDSATLRMAPTGVRLNGSVAGLGWFFDPTDGFLKHWITATGADNWTTFPALQNGWSGINPAYKRLPDGNVMFRGALVYGTTADNTIIATMPAGFRPTRANEYVCSTAGGANWNKISVDTAGVVRFFNGNGVPAGGNVQIQNILYSTI